MDNCPLCNNPTNMVCSHPYHILPDVKWRDMKDLDPEMVGVPEILVGCWVEPHPDDEREQFIPYWAVWVAVVGDDYGCEGFYGLPPTRWTYLPKPPKRI